MPKHSIRAVTAVAAPACPTAFGPAPGGFAAVASRSAGPGPAAASRFVPGPCPKSDVLNAGRKTFPGWPDTVLGQVPQLPFQYPVCRTWNVPDRAAVQRVATVGPVPALVVSGTFDAKTGAGRARDVVRDLSGSTAVQIPGIGHWVVPQSPCAQRVPTSFLALPTAPDTACVDGLEPKPFTIIPR
ncbi:alpha/beta hydrolase [Streptomyces sp. NPDC054932]